MNKTAYRVLRIGLGITFIWLGALIWQSPEAWGGFIQPWALKLLPGDLISTMKQTAILDMILGVWMIIGWRVWIPALIGSTHLAVVLITTTGSWSNIVVRDIGLIAATLALFLETMPDKIKMKLKIL
jgi:uncharacterized membrane protein YphA (DoxX/SURF4 family)